MPIELLTGAIATLTGAVVYLWRTMYLKSLRAEEISIKTEEKLEGRWLECERKHNETKDSLHVTDTKVASLEGRMEGYDQAKKDLQGMFKKHAGVDREPDVTTMSIGPPQKTD